jgi:hypothetical protein
MLRGKSAKSGPDEFVGIRRRPDYAVLDRTQWQRFAETYNGAGVKQSPFAVIPGDGTVTGVVFSAAWRALSITICSSSIPQTGGPPARAGFAYTALLMRRDWAFRRQLLPMLPVSISPLVALASGVRTDPFSGEFTPIHIVPHVFGVILFTVCGALVYGNDYKGSWVFLLTPSHAFDGFARGVYGLLWISLIGVPHLVLAGPLVWHWGIVHTGAFLAYSLAAASFYLGLELRLIEGVPFSKQPVVSRGVYFMGIMMLGGLCMAIAVGVQYVLLFRSLLAVLLASAALAGAAWAVTRSSLGSFAVSMRYNLGLASTEIGSMFREVDG